MKKFLTVMLATKSTAALFFTAFIAINIVINAYFYNETHMSYSFIIQSMFLSLIGATLQFYAFSNILFKKLRYSHRLFVFAITFFLITSAFAIRYKWFPSSIGNWLSFAAVYVLATIISTIVYEIYFRITGKKLTKSLALYQKKNLK